MSDINFYCISSMGAAAMIKIRRCQRLGQPSDKGQRKWNGLGLGEIPPHRYSDGFLEKTQTHGSSGLLALRYFSETFKNI